MTLDEEETDVTGDDVTGETREDRRSWPRRVLAGTVVVVMEFVACVVGSVAAQDEPRTASGRPDFTGTYDTATVTPLQRPVELGDRLSLTREQAAEIARERAEFAANAGRWSSPERDAPPVGGASAFGFEDDPEAGEALGAGRVGGYNWFWVDQGDSAFQIDGEFRTSIITDPQNGRMPAMTEDGGEKAAARIAAFRHENTGTAWWLGREVGPYDDIELRPLAERCILSRSRSGPPARPSLYNNTKRIVQTGAHFMVLAEQIHDARIVRMNSEHPPADVTFFMGDSIGYWEDDTLVVETTNFREHLDTSVQRKVTERFSRLGPDTLLYGFTVEDPATWIEPWSGEYPWRQTSAKLYEYACHEGNYAMGGIMRGARILEREALEAGNR
ncbi:MAG: hypothetical protein F4X59_14410 [Holophagales bacterium]|nr:hypothetical protein [Holophagales bacterium]MYC11305.1 hypothetical protein [Holophagales bacterium]